MDEYETAKAAFVEGQRLYTTQADSRNHDLRKYAMWIRKCEAEAESASAHLLNNQFCEFVLRILLWQVRKK
jgi:hypothetical protein